MDSRLPASWLCLLFCVLSFALVLPLAGGVVKAQEPDPSTGSGQGLPYDEEEAQAIDRSLMCPVCPAETIDQSRVELAAQMRGLVREMLAQGASRDEILDFFVERYGPRVLAAPPKSGVNLLAWILPIVGVVAALLLAGLVILWSMASGGGREPAAGPPLEDELEQYLEVIDRDLALQNTAAERSGRQASPLEQPEGDRGARGASNPGAPGVEPPRGEDPIIEDPINEGGR